MVITINKVLCYYLGNASAGKLTSPVDATVCESKKAFGT